MNSITIELPLPHKGLTPNSQDHTGRRFSLIKKAREVGFYCAFAALNRRNAPRWKSATASLARYGTSVQHPDRDNLIASLKHQVDGIAEAGIIENDKGLRWSEEVKFKVDKNNPRVEVTITRKD